MFIALLLLSIAILVISLFSYKNTDSVMPFIMTAISFFACIVLVCAIIGQIGTVVSGRTIDDRIALYEETNTEIDENIADTVAKYKDFESSTLSDLKAESAITLINLYPELKSDELVQSQIDIYINNQNEILQLKEKKLDLREAKWWLYFGG